MEVSFRAVSGWLTNCTAVLPMPSEETSIILLAVAAAVTLQQSTYVAREQLQLRVERTN
jgi:hypothetical protein